MRRTAVVTGGTRGLGAEITNRFHDAGYRVAVVARHPPTPAPVVSDDVVHYTADVTKPVDLERIRDQVVDRWGGIDVWINNAGYGKPMPFHESGTPEWARMFEVNFWGVVHGCRIAVGAMSETGGAIVNIASLAGLMAPAGHSAYSVSKAAVIALTRSLAVEFAARRVRVNAIAPGPLDTEGFRAAGGDPDRRAASIPTRQMILPSEVARTCLFLAEPLTSLTGATIALDGASSAGGCYV